MYSALINKENELTFGMMKCSICNVSVLFSALYAKWLGVLTGLALARHGVAPTLVRTRRRHKHREKPADDEPTVSARHILVKHKGSKNPFSRPKNEKVRPPCVLCLHSCCRRPAPPPPPPAWARTSRARLRKMVVRLALIIRRAARS